MSKNSSLIRLMNDLKSMRDNPPEGCSAQPMSDSNLYIWDASIFGPPDTPWEGGVYALRLTFPEQYPDKPPKVRFTCPIFHPNVYTDGTLCLDIIDEHWSPIYSVSSILTSIQSLLTDPNIKSPANSEAAKLYVHDIKEYNRRVRKTAEQSVQC